MTEMVSPLSRLIALLLLAGPALTQAGELGRLFFTPEERAAMDKERLLAGLSTSRTADIAPPMENVTFNGHVKRSSGASTVWLNNIQHPDGRNRIGVAEENHAPGEIAVKLPDSSRVYFLKVGQTLIPGNGEIREGYNQTSQIVATPADSEARAAPGIPSKTSRGGLDAANK